MLLPNRSDADQPLASGSAPLHPAPLRSAIPVLDDEKRAGHTLDATGETGALNDRNLPQVGTLSDDSEFASAEPGSAATYLPVVRPTWRLYSFLSPWTLTRIAEVRRPMTKLATLSRPKLFLLITLPILSASQLCPLTTPLTLTRAAWAWQTVTKYTTLP